MSSVPYLVFGTKKSAPICVAHQLADDFGWRHYAYDGEIVAVAELTGKWAKLPEGFEDVKCYKSNQYLCLIGCRYEEDDTDWHRFTGKSDEDVPWVIPDSMVAYVSRKLVSHGLTFSPELSRWIELNIANETGYIPGMMAYGATKEEILKVRELDRTVRELRETYRDYKGSLVDKPERGKKDFVYLHPDLTSHLITEPTLLLDAVYEKFGWVNHVIFYEDAGGDKKNLVFMTMRSGLCDALLTAGFEGEITPPSAENGFMHVLRRDEKAGTHQTDRGKDNGLLLIKIKELI